MKFTGISRGAAAEATVASRSIVVRRRPIEVSDYMQRGGGKELLLSLNCKGMLKGICCYYLKDKASMESCCQIGGGYVGCCVFHAALEQQEEQQWQEQHQ